MKLPSSASLDYRSKMNLYLAMIAIFMLAPFAVNNLIQGRLLLGLGAAFVVAVLAAKAWLITTNRYSELFSIFILVPMILGFLSISLQQ